MGRITGIGDIQYTTLAHIVPFTLHDRVSWERLLYAVVDKTTEMVEQFNRMDRVSSENLESIKAAYLALIEATNNALDGMESDLRNEYAVRFAELKRLIVNANRIGSMYDPTSGRFLPIDVVVNRVYDFARVHAMSASQIDAMSNSVAVFENNQRNAKQLDLIDFANDVIDPTLSMEVE